MRFRADDFPVLLRIASTNRLTLTEATSVLVAGWRQLTAEQREAAIRIPEPEPKAKAGAR